MTGSDTLVRVAQAAVGKQGDTLATMGLGSCVAVLLHDPVAEIGGMLHVLLPENPSRRAVDNPAKYATTGLPELVERMHAAGADPARLTARLVGGASMFPTLMVPGTQNVGEKNVIAVRRVLSRLEIPIADEDVGGDYGRTVRFDAGGGSAVVSTVGRGERVL